MAIINQKLTSINADTDLTTPLHDKIMLWLDNYVETHTFKQQFPDIFLEGYQILKTWECPIAKNNYLIGFADLRILINGVAFYFEVKSTIPSLGEVLRQVRKYQYATQDVRWFVVSPDTRFKNEIIKQKVGFITAFQDKEQ